MSILSKEQIKAMIEHYGIETPEDISSALKDMFGEALSEILNAELDTELGYEHGEKAPKNTSNRRNGKTRKTVRSSEFGDVDIAVPRDREGSFEPQIVKKNQKSVTGVEERIIAMYAKGMSTRDIEEHLRELYGIEASPTLVSNVTNKLLPVIQEYPRGQTLAEQAAGRSVRHCIHGCHTLQSPAGWACAKQSSVYCAWH